jgi:hypothetical protein
VSRLDAPGLETALRAVLEAPRVAGLPEPELLALCEVTFGAAGDLSPLMRLVLARVDDLVTTAYHVGRVDERAATVAHLRGLTSHVPAAEIESGAHRRRA